MLKRHIQAEYCTGALTISCEPLCEKNWHFLIRIFLSSLQPLSPRWMINCFAVVSRGGQVFIARWTPEWETWVLAKAGLLRLPSQARSFIRTVPLSTHDFSGGNSILQGKPGAMPWDWLQWARILRRRRTPCNITVQKEDSPAFNRPWKTFFAQFLGLSLHWRKYLFLCDIFNERSMNISHISSEKFKCDIFGVL